MKSAIRRHQTNRMKRKVRHWFWVWKDVSPRHIGIWARTRKLCGSCCHNPRKWEGPTLQELKGPSVLDWEDDFDIPAGSSDWQERMRIFGD